MVSSTCYQPALGAGRSGWSCTASNAASATVSCAAGLWKYVRAAATKPTAPRPYVEELRPYWHERLRGQSGARRLCAQLLIGDRLGFLDRLGFGFRERPFRLGLQPAQGLTSDDA